MTELFTHPVIRGALSGLLSAAAVDFAAFRKWQSFDELLTYNWKLAAWRWFQGVVVGGLVALGLGGMS